MAPRSGPSRGRTDPGELWLGGGHKHNPSEAAFEANKSAPGVKYAAGGVYVSPPLNEPTCVWYSSHASAEKWDRNCLNWRGDAAFFISVCYFRGLDNGAPPGRSCLKAPRSGAAFPARVDLWAKAGGRRRSGLQVTWRRRALVPGQRRCRREGHSGLMRDLNFEFSFFFFFSSHLKLEAFLNRSRKLTRVFDGFKTPTGGVISRNRSLRPRDGPPGALATPPDSPRPRPHGP